MSLREWTVIFLAAGLAPSCSGSPTVNVHGSIAIAGPHDRLWCSLELHDERDPRRTAGVIGVRADAERFDVTFTEGQEKIISDESTPLILVVSCDGFTPARRTVAHDPGWDRENHFPLIAMRRKEQ